MVVRPDRDAAGEEHDVGRIERLGDRLAGRAGVVGDVAGENDLRPVALGERGQRDAVGVVDLAGAERRAGGPQLVTGREHGDPGTRSAPQARAAGVDGDAERRRAQARSRAEDLVTRAQVLARLAHVAPGRDLLLQRDPLAVVRDELLLQHRVGAVGQHRAGRDPDRLAVGERDVRGAPGA